MRFNTELSGRKKCVFSDSSSFDVANEVTPTTVLSPITCKSTLLETRGVSDLNEGQQESIKRTEPKSKETHVFIRIICLFPSASDFRLDLPKGTRYNMSQ